MNYRTILLATAAVMFAGAANAEDITAPMYLPGAGKVLSNTSLQYERTSLKHNAGAGGFPRIRRNHLWCYRQFLRCCGNRQPVRF